MSTIEVKSSLISESNFRKGSFCFVIVYLMLACGVYFFKKNNIKLNRLAKITIIVMLIIALIHFYRFFTNSRDNRVLLIMTFIYVFVFSFYLLRYNIDNIYDFLQKGPV